MKSNVTESGRVETGANGANKKKPKEVGVKHGGDSIMLPDGMDTDAAIRLLERKRAEENQDKCIRERFNVSPPEGALALAKAMHAVFGITLAAEGGSNVTIETGVGQTAVVRWGRYDLPMGGYVETDTQEHDGRLMFLLHSHVLGKHEHSVRNLIQKMHAIVATESPYRGKAFSIELTDADGDALYMPTFKFLDLPKSPVNVILRREIERDLETCLWGPITRTDLVRKMGGQLGRKILLSGVYGTGKTLTSARTAQLCIQHNWTFLYLKKSQDLAEALEFARQYQPCVLFVEDIDRVAGLDRDDEVNDIVNALDGVNTKTSEVMVVYTTNHADQINPAMRRAGRIDSPITLLTPDAETGLRLVRYYAGGNLAATENIDALGARLNGMIPANIHEVVERAKFNAGLEGIDPAVITANHLDYAVGAIEREQAAYGDKPDKKNPGLGETMREFGHALVAASRNGHAVPASPES